MANLSDYLENALLAHSVGRTAFAMPTGVFLALYTVAPSDAGGGTEVTGGAYARQQTNTSWAAPAGGSITTNLDITYPTATANWGTITHLGLHDAVTLGNLLWHGALSASKTINNGDVFKIVAGNLTLTLA